jgi:chromosome segregation ATPase
LRDQIDTAAKENAVQREKYEKDGTDQRRRIKELRERLRQVDDDQDAIHHYIASDKNKCREIQRLEDQISVLKKQNGTTLIDPGAKGELLLIGSVKIENLRSRSNKAAEDAMNMRQELQKTRDRAERYHKIILENTSAIATTRSDGDLAGRFIQLDNEVMQILSKFYDAKRPDINTSQSLGDFSNVRENLLGPSNKTRGPMRMLSRSRARIFELLDQHIFSNPIFNFHGFQSKGSLESDLSGIEGALNKMSKGTSSRC